MKKKSILSYNPVSRVKQVSPSSGHQANQSYSLVEVPGIKKSDYGIDVLCTWLSFHEMQIEHAVF